MEEFPGNLPGKALLEGVWNRDQYKMPLGTDTAYDGINYQKPNEKLKSLMIRDGQSKRTLSALYKDMPISEINVETYLDEQAKHLDTLQKSGIVAEQEYKAMLDAGQISQEMYNDMLEHIAHKRCVLRHKRDIVTIKRRKISESMLSYEVSSMDEAFARTMSALGGDAKPATLPFHTTRSTWTQNDFRRRVIAAMDADYPMDPSEEFKAQFPGKQGYKWCCATQCYHPADSVVAAHIIQRKYSGPVLVTALGLQHLIDDGGEIIWDTRNGIMLHRKIETAYDDARIVIVPIIEDGSDDQGPVDVTGVKVSEDIADDEANEQEAAEEEIRQQTVEGLQRLIDQTDNVQVRANYEAMMRTFLSSVGNAKGTSAAFRKVVFHPASTRFKIVVLDRTLLSPTTELNPDSFPKDPKDDGINYGSIRTFDQLNNRELGFRNDHRPWKRNFYFAYVNTLIRRQTTQPPGFERDFEALPDVKGVWATPGKWYLRSTLRSLTMTAGINDYVLMGSLDEDVNEILSGGNDEDEEEEGNAEGSASVTHFPSRAVSVVVTSANDE